jgi:hypothetical protein
MADGRVGSVSQGRARDGRSGDGDCDGDGDEKRRRAAGAHPCGLRHVGSERGEAEKWGGGERPSLTCGASRSSDSRPRLFCASAANHGGGLYRIPAAHRKDGPSRCTASPCPVGLAGPVAGRAPTALPKGKTRSRDPRQLCGEAQGSGTWYLHARGCRLDTPPAGGPLPAPDCRGRPCLCWEQPTGPLCTVVPRVPSRVPPNPP